MRAFKKAQLFHSFDCFGSFISLEGEFSWAKHQIYNTYKNREYEERPLTRQVVNFCNR